MYFKVRKLGEGTYATIYLAKEIEKMDETDIFTAEDPHENFTRYVAIKRIKKTEYGTGIEVNAIREIKTFKKTQNEYLLKMLNIFEYKGDIHIVLEYVEYSLDKIIRSKEIVLMPSDIKSWVFMLLMGLKELHDNYILHRDLKPNNLLITEGGKLKVADFGLCRKITEAMTPSAVTRWYRAPEMLLGIGQYSFSGDIWSVGVIMAEMFIRAPFFAAETDIQQLECICRVLGTPKNFDLFDEKTVSFKLKHFPPVDLKNIFTAVSDDAIDLLKNMLQFDPRKRISVNDALNHVYFRTKPFATKIENLPKPK